MTKSKTYIDRSFLDRDVITIYGLFFGNHECEKGT